jgi:hypothetical protein
MLVIDFNNFRCILEKRKIQTNNENGIIKSGKRKFCRLMKKSEVKVQVPSSSRNVSNSRYKLLKNQIKQFIPLTEGI